MNERGIGLLIMIVVLLGACGGSDDTPTDTAPPPAATDTRGEFRTAFVQVLNEMSTEDVGSVCWGVTAFGADQIAAELASMYEGAAPFYPTIAAAELAKFCTTN